LAGAWGPRRKSAIQVAALAAAVIIALQIAANYWLYSYITWFFPMVLVALFVGWELRQEHPLLDLRVFRDAAYSASVLVGVLLAGGMFGATFVVPVFLQQIQGYSAQGAGLILAAQGIGSVVALPISGWLTDRLDPRFLLAWYYGFRGLAVIALPFVFGSTYALFIFAGLVVFNFFSEMAYRSPMLLHEYAHFIKQTIFPSDMLAVISTLRAAAYTGIGAVSPVITWLPPFMATPRRPRTPGKPSAGSTVG